MTVIAYKDGILAADTGCWQDGILVGETQKIVVTEISCFAAAGALTSTIEFKDWAIEAFVDRLRPKRTRDLGAICVYRSGRVLLCGETFELYEPNLFPNWHVQGAHTEFLRGAMAVGASAIEAIEAAITSCPWAAGSCIAFDTATGKQTHGRNQFRK
jgi:hypothetical protein